MSGKCLKLTREKHLDHMVKVVPFIVFVYGVQSYVLWKIDGPISGTSLLVLGFLLVSMIGIFLVYDLKHSVEFFEDRLETSFLSFKKTILYSDIKSIETTDPTQSFGTIYIKYHKTQSRFYFVDDVDKIKDWVLSNKNSHSNSIAA